MPALSDYADQSSSRRKKWRCDETLKADEAAYQAAHSGCLAVLATRGLRTASGHGHHEMAFAGVAALGVPGLDQLIPDSEEIRMLRSGSMYDPVFASVDDRKRAVAWTRKVLPRMRAVLLEWDPSLDPELAAARP